MSRPPFSTGSSIWHEAPPLNTSLQGHRIHALAPGALRPAVEELLALNGVERYLKVRSGEHIAAILLTAVCSSAPTRLDSDGGIDLIFDRSNQQWPFGDLRRAAVEVKSLPGRWRRFEARVQIGQRHDVKIRHAADILQEASSVILDGANALKRKTGPEPISRSVFLLVHPMDGFAIEAHGDLPIIGHLLPKLSSGVEVDRLWVLWHPHALTMWSQGDGVWTDILFDQVAHEHSSPGAESFDLGSAEEMLLEGIGQSGTSPWPMRFS